MTGHTEATYYHKKMGAPAGAQNWGQFQLALGGAMSAESLASALTHLLPYLFTQLALGHRMA
ncbi:hypothetical protein P7K49_018222 [Saguinus oedipus]|uniref:Uncharacterized protein n=1 Tax=Saguinus oedipus TaxID=9490 RepID=A0ABQ9V4T6_SAGOE|nr:hypothetical protein P7K49_018222 [Saguinus oedipus]